MIQTTHSCSRCKSTKLKKNETTAKGQQKFYCHECGKYGTLNPEPRYTEERKEEIIRAYQERSRLRGIERSFGVTRQTVATWIKKSPSMTPFKREFTSFSKR